MHVEVDNKTQYLQRIKMKMYIYVCIRIFIWHISESVGHKAVIEEKSILKHFTNQNKIIYLNELIKISG